jgi:hypothetical protein
MLEGRWELRVRDAGELTRCSGGSRDESAATRKREEGGIELPDPVFVRAGGSGLGVK